MTKLSDQARARIAREYDRGRTAKDLADEFGVNPRTIKRLIQLRDETGSVAPRPHGGGPVALLSDEARAELARLRGTLPCATQTELASLLQAATGVKASRGTIGAELRAMGYRRKKGTTPREKVPKKRSTRSASTRYKPAKPAPTTPSGRKPYPSDLSDNEWALIAPYIPAAKPGGRAEEHSKREIVNAILYVLRSGCQWRMLPHDFPPQTTVYDYFRAWRDAGVWQQLNRILREQLRMRLGRNPLPSAGIVDSQSAKTTEKGGRVDMTGRSA